MKKGRKTADLEEIAELPLKRVISVFFLQMINSSEVSISDKHVFFEAALNSIADAIVIADTHRRIIFMNHAAKEFLGYLSGDSQGKATQSQDATTDDDTRDSGSFRWDRKAGNPVFQLLYQSRNDEVFLDNAEGKEIQDKSGNVLGFINIYHNINEGKQEERAILEKLERIKLFAYCVSHDLKNPAVAMNGLARLFWKKYNDMLDAKGLSYCEQILKLSQQIVSFVQDINTYILTNESPLDVEVINIKEILRALRKEFDMPLKQQHVQLVAPENMPLIKVDRLALIRALRNLIDNALKYGGESLSEIEIGLIDTPEHHVLFVRDDGIGMDEQDVEGIFEVFKRSSKTKGTEGTGLGLAIVKEIAEHHAGRVWVKSGLERGITFHMAISKNL